MNNMLTNKRMRGLALISFPALAVIIAVFTFLYPKITEFEAVNEFARGLDITYIIAFLILALFHCCALFFIFARIRQSQERQTVHAAILVLIMLSLLLLGADTVLLRDITTQYEHKMSTGGEWLFLFINHFIHLLSLLAMTLFLSAGQTSIREEMKKKDEAAFLVVQNLGIICGLLGLAGIITAVVLNLEQDLLHRVLFSFGIILILPYCAGIIFWLVVKTGEKQGSWYDEKQFQDMAKAGLMANVGSVIFLFIFYILFFQGPGVHNGMELLWFPLFLFFNITIFSGGTLYCSYH